MIRFPHSAPRRSRRGSAIVMMTLTMALIIGVGALVVDVGMMMLEAHTLQRASDAAALAAAARLEITPANSLNPDTAASTSASRIAAANEAVFIASRNGVVITPSAVTFPGAGRVQVRADGGTTMFLARIWGVDQAALARSATAEKSSVAAMRGLAPLGLSMDDFTANGKGGGTFSVSLARNTSDPFGSGNALALSLDNNPSKPVAIFERELNFGASTLVELGQTINSLNGANSQQNALRDAMNARLSRNDDVFPVLILPAKGAAVGTSVHAAQAFAMVRVRSVSMVSPPGAKGKSDEVATLVLEFVPGKTIGSSDSGLQLARPGRTPIHVVRLVDDPA